MQWVRPSAASGCWPLQLSCGRCRAAWGPSLPSRQRAQPGFWCPSVRGGPGGACGGYQYEVIASLLAALPPASRIGAFPATAKEAGAMSDGTEGAGPALAAHSKDASAPGQKP